MDTKKEPNRIRSVSQCMKDAEEGFLVRTGDGSVYVQNIVDDQHTEIELPKKAYLSNAIYCSDAKETIINHVTSSSAKLADEKRMRYLDKRLGSASGSNESVSSSSALTVPHRNDFVWSQTSNGLRLTKRQKVEGAEESEKRKKAARSVQVIIVHDFENALTWYRHFMQRHELRHKCRIYDDSRHFEIDFQVLENEDVPEYVIFTRTVANSSSTDVTRFFRSGIVDRIVFDGALGQGVFLDEISTSTSKSHWWGSSGKSKGQSHVTAPFTWYVTPYTFHSKSEPVRIENLIQVNVTMPDVSSEAKLPEDAMRFSLRKEDASVISCDRKLFYVASSDPNVTAVVYEGSNLPGEFSDTERERALGDEECPVMHSRIKFRTIARCCCKRAFEYSVVNNCMDTHSQSGDGQSVFVCPMCRTRSVMEELPAEKNFCLVVSRKDMSVWNLVHLVVVKDDEDIFDCAKTLVEAETKRLRELNPRSRTVIFVTSASPSCTSEWLKRHANSLKCWVGSLDFVTAHDLADDARSQSLMDVDNIIEYVVTEEFPRDRYSQDMQNKELCKGASTLPISQALAIFLIRLRRRACGKLPIITQIIV